MAKNDILLQELYEGKKYLRVKFSSSPYLFHLVLHGRDNTPDCYVTSFQANLYFRTEKGCTRQKYTSYKRMLNEVTKRANKVLGDNTVIKEIDIFDVTEENSLPLF